MLKISIITVTFNNLSGLKKTIESVTRQTYPEKEYIIIDGGSIDGSINLIKNYGSKIDLWLSESDNGIYDAMNKGIKLATGEWILFMNSGDIFCDSGTLDVIFTDKLFEKTDIIYGNTIYSDTNKLLRASEELNRYYFFSDTLCHQSLFTSRSSFKKVGYYNPDYKYISDREWLLRAKIADLKFHYVNEVVSIWDPNGFCKTNPGSVSMELDKMRKSYFTCLEISILWTIYKLTNLLRRSLFYKALQLFTPNDQTQLPGR
jgi:glycosyltransferase involved in cell wall biosynthesis